MEVTCPDGVRSGQLIIVHDSDGNGYEITVPEGVVPGDTFIAQVGAAADDTEEITSATITSTSGTDNVAKPEDQRELVVGLVEHAQKLLEGDLLPFFDAKVHLFLDQVEEGETLEQYAAFQEYEAELERHFDSFAAARGFASPTDCFAAVDRATVDDMARQKRAMQELQEKLIEMQRAFEAARQGEARLVNARVRLRGLQARPELNGRSGRAIAFDAAAGRYAVKLDDDEGVGIKVKAANLEAEDGGEDGEATASDGGDLSKATALAGGGSLAALPNVTFLGEVGGGDGTAAPLMIFSQPIGLKELLDQALTLAEYTTFASVMRMKAKQVHMRRTYLDEAPERAAARSQRAEVLEAGASEGSAREMWTALRSRTDAHLAKTLPPPLLALMQHDASSEMGKLDECLKLGDSPPEGASKVEMLQLVAALMRLSTIAPPQDAVKIMSEIQRVQQVINAEELGCLSILFDAEKADHHRLAYEGDARELARQQMRASLEDVEVVVEEL